MNPRDSTCIAAPRALAPVTADVDLWWCELDIDDVAQAERAALLAPAEHARAARFGTATLRRRWIAGRGALRIVLGRLLDEVPGEIDIRRGRRGRPELAGAAPDFNVSHTNGVAVIGVARRGRIGIDIERGDRAVGADRLAKRFLAPAERITLGEMPNVARGARFLRYWTCKEAMSKATGDGLIAPFAQLHVDVDRVELLDGPPPYLPAEWRLHSVAAPAPYLVTVALWRSWSTTADGTQ